MLRRLFTGEAFEDLGGFEDAVARPEDCRVVRRYHLNYSEEGSYLRLKDVVLLNSRLESNEEEEEKE